MGGSTAQVWNAMGSRRKVDGAAHAGSTGKRCDGQRRRTTDQWHDDTKPMLRIRGIG